MSDYVKVKASSPVGRDFTGGTARRDIRKGEQFWALARDRRVVEGYVEVFDGPGGAALFRLPVGALDWDPAV